MTDRVVVIDGPTHVVEGYDGHVVIVTGGRGPQGPGGGGTGGEGGAVNSVDGRTGDVTLADRYQPVDSDLSAIAALTTTVFGRNLLTLVNTAAAQAAFGLGTAAVANVGDFDPAGAAAAAQAASQPLDSDLTAIAASATTAYGRALLTLVDATALRTAAALGTIATHPTTDFIPATDKGAAGGVASLGVDGLVPTSQLPPLAINEVFVVNSQAAMLALNAQRGDAARRTDTTPNKLFLLTTDDPTVLGNWLDISVTDAVSSVNGRIGAVNLDDLYQPLDSDLTAIAALGTTTFGRNLLTMANAAALKTLLAIVPGDVTGFDTQVATTAILKALGTNKGDIAVWTASGTVVRKGVGTDGQGIIADSAQSDGLKYVSLERNITIVIDGGGSVIATGAKKVYVSVPFDCTIVKARVVADQVGSIVLDVWKDTYANFPPTVADTITAAAKPTLSGAQKAEDTTLTGWTTQLTAGDVLEVNVDSVATVTKVILTLRVRPR